jgi:hypothetical protein
VDDENEDGLLLRISLEYAADGRRPKQGCVKIKVSGTQQDRYIFFGHGVSRVGTGVPQPCSVSETNKYVIVRILISYLTDTVMKI